MQGIKIEGKIRSLYGLLGDLKISQNFCMVEIDLNS